MNRIESIPEGFNLLSNAISQLSKDILSSVTDLIQKIRVSDEIIGGRMTGNIQVALDYSDEDAKDYGLVFIMSPETDFALELTYGRLPEAWNIPEFNKALYKFALFMTKWQPVHSVLFCPMMNPQERYTPQDLKESYYTPDGWVLNIRGIFNDGEEFIKGLNLFPLENSVA